MKKLSVEDSDPGWGKNIRIRDEHPGSFSRERRNSFLGWKYQNSLMRIRIRIRSKTNKNKHFLREKIDRPLFFTESNYIWCSELRFNFYHRSTDPLRLYLRIGWAVPGADVIFAELNHLRSAHGATRTARRLDRQWQQMVKTIANRSKLA
jgi:hypothetical protein